MSSPTKPFMASSSPVSPSTRRRRKSRFSYKQLASLASYAVNCPLRVIAHIDLDAFYAQCEMVRLGVPEDKPLAVQQWQGLIAINYPARAFGLSRHVTIAEAQKVCPHIILQHVATWKEGEDNWAYRDDAFKNMGTHKVSLDPYRLQSRRILALIKEELPAARQKVEKASIDEVFLDLSAHVHSILLERFPILTRPAPYDDPTELLPAPPTSALDWTADAMIDLDSQHSEEDDPDWDDIAMNIGSEIVRSVRAAIREQLHYTCSAGLAKNKMLAKLGSGHKKPNNQTIVRNRAIQHFLSDFKFTKIRNLGGKFGDEVVETFQTDTVKDLLGIPIEQMRKKLGDDSGSWLYSIIRGEDSSEVNPRTQIKSMLSAKSFRPSINDFDAGLKWLRIFSADIYARLVEDGVLEHKRRPRTINLSHRQGGSVRSKSAQIPQGKTIDENVLFELAKNLLAQVVVDGRAWPCANLSLSVHGFEDGPAGTKGIGTFLVRGEEARALSDTAKHGRDESPARETGVEKKRRLEERRLDRFFPTRESSRDDAEPTDFEDVPSAQGANEASGNSSETERTEQQLAYITDAAGEQDDEQDHSFTCDKCSRRILAEQRDEHEDWHFARTIQLEQCNQQQQQRAPSKSQQTTRPPSASRGRARGRPATGTTSKHGSTSGKERGQTRLTF